MGRKGTLSIKDIFFKHILGYFARTYIWSALLCTIVVYLNIHHQSKVSLKPTGLYTTRLETNTKAIRYKITCA